MYQSLRFEGKTINKEKGKFQKFFFNVLKLEWAKVYISQFPQFLSSDICPGGTASFEREGCVFSLLTTGLALIYF